jgi:hypothetical protein
MAKKLKAFVRFDGSGKIVPSSVILQRSKPKVGNWKEIPSTECCNYISSYNFDITGNWNLTTPSVVDATSFKIFLESGVDGDGNDSRLTNVIISNFSLISGRLKCNLFATQEITDIYGLTLSGLEITNITFFGNIQQLNTLRLDGNLLSSVDNVTFPFGLEYLDLTTNPIVEFNPIIALPSTLIQLSLGNTLFTYFNPTLPLPENLSLLQFFGGSMTTAGYTASEPWANNVLGVATVDFRFNTDSVTGTNLETILISKGWIIQGNWN